MPPFHVLQVRIQPLTDAGRQYRPPIFLALAALNENFLPIEVDVLHTELETLQQPQPGSIEQRHNDPRPPLKVLAAFRSRSQVTGENRFFTVSSTKTKCLVARGLRPSAIRRRSRKGHPSQPRRPSGWLGAHAWTPPSRPPIQERGPRRRPPQNLEIERANDRNTPIFIGLQLLQEPLMRVLKSTKSPKIAEHPHRMRAPARRPAGRSRAGPRGRHATASSSLTPARAHEPVGFQASGFRLQEPAGLASHG